ncbi:hypothetical protein MHBO_003116 [Bonamia ostreae]|uniref:Uncharacterized protein n=1 Tax=Bonamia ostreae TaxID=126728 RepID=A0ABV2AQ40_9EUKA
MVYILILATFLFQKSFVNCECNGDLQLITYNCLYKIANGSRLLRVDLKMAGINRLVFVVKGSCYGILDQRYDSLIGQIKGPQANIYHCYLKTKNTNKDALAIITKENIVLIGGG